MTHSVLDFDKALSEIWREERIALTESIGVSKQEALRFLAYERERIMRLSHDEAIKEVLKSRKLDSRVKAVNKVVDNGILNPR